MLFRPLLRIRSERKLVFPEGCLGRQKQHKRGHNQKPVCDSGTVCNKGSVESCSPFDALSEEDQTGSMAQERARRVRIL